MSINRKTIREAYATLLETNLVGDGLPVQVVYEYQKASFSDQSPVVVVTSDGCERVKGAMPSIAHGGIFLAVYSFVLHNSESDDWTEQDSEDRLDLIEKSITDINLDNLVNPGYWHDIERPVKSEVANVLVGETMYRREKIILRFSTQDD